MYTSKHCVYVTYYDIKPENNLGNGFITCVLGYLSKSWGWKEEGTSENLKSRR